MSLRTGEGRIVGDLVATFLWSAVDLAHGEIFLQNVCRTLHLSAHAASYGNLPAAYAPAKRAAASYFEPFKNAG